MLKTNYHTHTTFCDGKNTAEEMVNAAIKANFDILGFSSHSMYPFGSTWHLSPSNHDEYCDKINWLKETYRSQLEIYLGFEADFIDGICNPHFSNYREFSPDYLIGAVHYVPGNTGYFEADGSFDEVRQKIDSVFKGNVKKAVQAYFAAEREMLKKGSFTFMAHPDLIRKQNSLKNEKGPLFHENESWYKKEISLTAKDIAQAGVCVEINTGGMARGYMDLPYPSAYFMEKLFEYKVPLTINSDSHSVKTLDYWFEEAVQYAKKTGYKELMFFRSGHLESQSIQ